MGPRVPGFSGLSERFVRTFGGRLSWRDALVLLTVAGLVVVLEMFVDLLPMLADWSRQHPAWHFDTLFTLLVVLAVAFFAFAPRRMREIGAASRQPSEPEVRSEAEGRLRDFVAVADEWFWETDDQLRLVEVDERAPAGLVALARERAPWQPQAGDEDAWARHRAELAARKPFRGFRFGLRDAAGAVRQVQISGRPFFDGDGAFRGYRGTGSDVTAAMRAEAESAHLAHYDPLTDLPNRMRLRDEVEHAVALARSHRQAAALLRIDLDRFREINDTLGSQAGDLLLQACARRLASTLGEDDRLARIGGDEFAIVQRSPDQPEAALALAHRLLASFGDPFDLDGREVIATASIGVALIGGEQAGDEVIGLAGVALHRAKQEGRDTFCLFEPGMEASVCERRALEWDLKRGLQEGELQLAYQPQIDATTRAVVAVEALVRWLHPERGLLEAREFMAEADETALSLPLGTLMLHTACAQAANWPALRVAVPLSPGQFRHRDLAVLVEEALVASGLDPARLELEVPERALLADPDAALATLERLRALGVRLALGDLARGFTRLAQRHGFAFDQVRIDRLFTASLAERTDAQAAAHAIEAIAHGLGCTVCVEGVESEEQETLMITAGCAVLQGGYYSSAVGPGVIEALLGEPGDEAGSARPPQRATSAA